ncbi:Helix-turn-helix domain-containing protein [Glycomyces sambucus]|uniref:Helix-turn-helix domain-containing protein n=1 Tax=Glycomyces sambucus TaxID=380244 RepID=A0A1G9CPC2_9ACTN|nr:Helix-turn-helix domain-containing protein [Glycomyces sambucus]
MLRLTVSTRDVSQVRMAFSPLWEVVASLRALHAPASHAVHLPWVKRARRQIREAALDLEPLTALACAHPHRLPGFLAPTPTTPTPDLRTELADLRDSATLDPAALDPAALDLAAADSAGLNTLDLDEPPFADSTAPIVRELRSDPAAGLARICRTIERYWALVLEPHWPRMRSLLEADVLYRARQFADGGAGRLLNGLDATVAWEDGVLTIEHGGVSDERRLDGRGLVLVPSVFVWPRVATKTDRRWQPVLRYPARGVGTLWERGSATTLHALAAVIGRSRARLLAELSAPVSTTDLAARTGMSPAGVSAHLTALRDAGLVTATRIGRSVLYVRTTLGDDLLPPDATGR